MEASSYIRLGKREVLILVNSCLDVFFDPKTVAVIGVSRIPEKVGNVIFSNFIESNFRGKVYPVNPKAKTVYGVKAYSSVLEIPDEIDIAITAVPADVTPKVIAECVEKGVKGAIIVSGGYSETGEEGRRREEEILRGLRKAGARMIGPNCIGIYDSNSEFDTIFMPRYRMSRPQRGNISFISQSGAFGVAVLDWAATRGFGVSKFISLGNKIDINEIDCLEYLAEDESTKVIVLYLESVTDGGKFMEVAHRTTPNKPIVVLKAGRTVEGTGAVLSHTGSLAGSDHVYDAAFKQSGIIRAYDPQDLFDIARALALQPMPKGDRIAVITNGGGFGVIAVDSLVEYGLRIAEFSDSTLETLKRKLPLIVSKKNPLDLIGDADSERYRIALEAVMLEENVDGILVIMLFQTPELQPDVVGVISAASNLREKPILVCATGGDFAMVHTHMLERAGIPVFPTPNRAARAMATLVSYMRTRQKLTGKSNLTI